MARTLPGADVLSTWDYNLLELGDACWEEGLMKSIGKLLFTHYGLIEYFNLSEERLSCFLSSLDSLYRKSNPYHSAAHAVDVAINVHFLLQSGFLRFFTKMDLLVLCVAALGHDAGHFALNNAFLVNSDHEIVRKYGAVSALEHFHVSKLMEVLEDENSFVHALSPSDLVELKTMVTKMVLATDMSRHRDYFTQFEEWCNVARKESGVTQGDNDRSWVEARIPNLSPAERTLFMSMVVKCADLANVVKPVEQAEAWAERIMREFQAQGERELALALPLTQPAKTANFEWQLAKHQLGFLENVVGPLYQSMMELADEESRSIVLNHAKRNAEIWSKRVHDLDPERN
uniref:PDEase domain-containing protein n=1 Tax=Pyramimonas obovata TaxID=1411642 RepID=A0A7S0WKN7_9CHLO|mmetsp:Transcript_28701/g.62875  ORF Transcript_28701/g.62875 Transcript_28701/m.62875 type:complete len:345 (+) Transcript_28701:164-1198(+)|eukprot:CAMPEP_0118934782 /NCGR_PEP_ID=MMETSP1169-20130426/14139_1 /TAXON_ID=36882 /ORGANISM="Pyramimonas obovata, Strain CCMP722" /LENGTH=344 /DNA_ID=CAMNT_0006877719 /DNA_START=164 /DNA_END=1198 /DNA_ORIENTATION=+